MTESTAARADGTLDLASLPKAELVPPPVDAKKPARLGAGEKVPGFYLGYVQANDMTMLTPDKAEFESWQGTRMPSETANPSCFTPMVEHGWGDGGEQRVYLRGGGGGQSEVMAYRRTEVVGNGDEATLKETVAWIDPITRGARLVGSKEVPMKRLSHQYGVSVYVAAGNDASHFAVIEDNQNSTRGNTLMTERPGGSFQHTQCHAITTLRMPKQGSSDVATTYVTGDLGPVQQNSNPKNRGGSTFELHRTRTMAVQASVSWLGRDKAPVLSWSVGWVGPESQENVEVPKTKS